MSIFSAGTTCTKYAWCYHSIWTTIIAVGRVGRTLILSLSDFCSIVCFDGDAIAHTLLRPVRWSGPHQSCCMLLLLRMEFLSRAKVFAPASSVSQRLPVNSSISIACRASSSMSCSAWWSVILQGSAERRGLGSITAGRQAKPPSAVAENQEAGSCYW